MSLHHCHKLCEVSLSRISILSLFSCRHTQKKSRGKNDIFREFEKYKKKQYGQRMHKARGQYMKRTKRINDALYIYRSLQTSFVRCVVVVNVLYSIFGAFYDGSMHNGSEITNTSPRSMVDTIAGGETRATDKTQCRYGWIVGGVVGANVWISIRISMGSTKSVIGVFFCVGILCSQRCCVCIAKIGNN